MRGALYELWTRLAVVVIREKCPNCAAAHVAVCESCHGQFRT